MSFGFVFFIEICKSSLNTKRNVLQIFYHFIICICNFFHHGEDFNFYVVRYISLFLRLLGFVFAFSSSQLYIYLMTNIFLFTLSMVSIFKLNASAFGTYFGVRSNIGVQLISI